jgi:hypothetical protein
MENSQQFQYMMLSRLQSDCEYFLGYGKRSVRNLWADNIVKHIAEMKRLWNELIIKPEWLSLENIIEYENKMLNDIQN